MSFTLDDAAVAAITKHMNGDHAEDNLLICRALGGQPPASAARMTGCDTTGIDFTATVDDTEVPVRVPFAAEITERVQVRHEVVRMYEESCAALGLTPRGH